jgi:hypothetical protein
MISHISRKIIRIPLTIACTTLDERQVLTMEIYTRPPQQYRLGAFQTPAPAFARLLSTRAARPPLRSPADPYIKHFANNSALLMYFSRQCSKWAEPIV